MLTDDGEEDDSQLEVKLDEVLNSLLTPVGTLLHMAAQVCVLVVIVFDESIVQIAV